MNFHQLFNEISMMHLWKKLTQEIHRDNWSSQEVCSWWDEINPNNEPDEKGDETREWITTVTHDPEDRQADGRWEESIIQKKAPVWEIRWKDYDKNSDELYAPKQHLPQSDYNARDKEIFERRVSKIGNC